MLSTPSPEDLNPASGPGAPTGPRITRRSLLAGAAGLGAAVVLGACGTSDTTVGSGGQTATTKSGPTGSELLLVAVFDPNTFALAGSEQRLVVNITDARNVVPPGLPPTVPFSLLQDGKVVVPPTPVASHADGLVKPYFPVRMTPPAEGIYTLRADVGGTPIDTLVKVSKRGGGPRPEVGDPFVVTDTPTLADARGVTPICTQDPPCPLHEVNLRDALAAGRPTALIVSTPRFCQIGICGPVLTLVVEQQAAFPGVQFVHAEPYADPMTDGKSNSPKTAPIIDALGIDWEPALFVVGADGKLRERLDNAFDRADIKAALAKATA